MKLQDARLLVVDDEAALRGIFSKWLSNAGCARVRTAANGEEAMEAIREEPIDVLITDVRMPVMDGVNLVRKLAEKGERIPTIIFVSGFGDVDPREMYDLGVETFLAKPFRLEELATAVDRAIADRDVLWASAMEISPRQTVHLSLSEALPDGTGAKQIDDPSQVGFLQFSLGRGGFSARADEALGLGKISFLCVFPTDEASPDLCGEGYVRWRSRLDQTVGIEFAFLESPGREWVVKQIAESNPRPFIPALREEGSG